MKRLIVLIALLLPVSAQADVVLLTDGTRLEGSVRRSGDGFAVTDAKGQVRIVAPDEIRSIQILQTPDTRPTTSALEDLRGALADCDDPKQAIDRYHNFLAAHPDGPAAIEARSDLAQWQDRLDRHLVRIGRRWLSADEARRIQDDAHAAAESVRTMLASDHLADAAAAIVHPLADSPRDPSLLYLDGIIQFRLKRLVPARRAFERVVAELPDHGPAHNNLAVVLWMTNGRMPAMAEYERAMRADPVNQTILDNTAEALHGLTESQAKSPLAVRVEGEFKSQDALLQQRLAAHGLHRQGSQWLSNEEFARVQAERKAASEQITDAPSTALNLQARLMEIDRTLDRDRKLLTSIQEQETQLNPVTGTFVTVAPPPDRYNDIRNEIAQLTMERVMKQRQLDQLPHVIDEARRTLAAGDFKGIQKIMDESFAPGLKPPATRPTTAPAGDF